MSINYDLALVLKIDGDLAANVGLHLAKTPIRFVRMTHQHAWLKNRNKVTHTAASMKGPGR